MKPMPYATSPRSYLTPRPYPFEELNIAGIIEDVEQRVRIMCRMAQLYRCDGRPSNNVEEEISNMATGMEVFYEFVDRQMDTLSALTDAIGDNGDGYVSLNQIREKFHG